MTAENRPEKMTDNNIRSLSDTLSKFGGMGEMDETAIEYFRQALEVVSGKREWVSLPSGMRFRLNTNPAEAISRFDLNPIEGFNPDSILETIDPGMDDLYPVSTEVNSRLHNLEG